MIRAIVTYLATLLETRLDSLISTFTKLDGKLEAFIDRQDRRIDRERDLRAASMNRTFAAMNERDRATRIRSRVRDIIG